MRNNDGKLVADLDPRLGNGLTAFLITCRVQPHIVQDVLLPADRIFGVLDVEFMSV